MTIRAIAWDIDGTLVDSEPLHHRALLGASRRWGTDLSDLREQHFRGVHMQDVWDTLMPRYPATLARGDWLAAIEDHYVAEVGTLTPLDGAVAAIHAFAAAGLRQACVSNSSRRVVDANIAALGIGHDIAFSISLDDVARGKPDPLPYRQACAAFGLPPHEVLAVEDSATGLTAALAAGLRTAAVGPDLFDNRDAEIVVSRFDDLVTWVTRPPPRTEAGPPTRGG